MEEHKESMAVRDVISQATELLIHEGYTAYDPGNRRANDVLARSKSAEVLSAAVSAVSFGPGERTYLMTHASPTLVFLDGRKMLAGIGCVTPGYIRCEKLWEGDAPLINELALHDLIKTLVID